jgi:uncharacterized membrane protein
MIKNLMRNLGLTIAGVMLMIAPVVFISTPANAAVDARDAVCEGLGAATGGAGCEEPAGESTLNGTVTNAINIISLVVAVIAVIMVIVGGLKYITSQGESAGTAGAKNTIIYAIVGLIIVALAQLIVRFVVNRVTTDQPATQAQTETQAPNQSCELVNGQLPAGCR